MSSDKLIFEVIVHFDEPIDVLFKFKVLLLQIAFRLVIGSEESFVPWSVVTVLIFGFSP